MTKSYHQRHIQLRAKRGSEEPIAIILEYLESLPYKYDVQQECHKLLINKHMVVALKKGGHSEEELKSSAYQAIGYFEGIINSLKDAAGIKEEYPHGKAPFLAGFPAEYGSNAPNGKTTQNGVSSDNQNPDTSNGMSEAKTILGIG